MNSENNTTTIINKEPMVYVSENISLLKEISVLDNGQLYIYVMLNYPQGNIKIGKTTNIQQRLNSLSGSNGGGNQIIKLYCSPATWVQSMETAIHSYYHKYRIEGTEWFDGSDLDFNDVVKHVNSLFYTKSYDTCNRLRKEIIERERAKIAEMKALEENNVEETTSKKSKDKKNKGKK